MFKEINPEINLRVMYDIGCSLQKFIQLVSRFTSFFFCWLS
jgi:hypothetical protein